jgi:hypothetical protein
MGVPAPGGELGCEGAPAISRAILIDREVDLVTPCMTQITLEGLIDEVTGIKGGAVPWTPNGEVGISWGWGAVHLYNHCFSLVFMQIPGEKLA